MSTRARRARGRPPRTPVSINRTNFLRKPKAYQNLEQNLNRNGSPSPVTHLKFGRSERIRGRASAIRGRQFMNQFMGEDDEVSSLPEFEDRSSDITDLDNTDAYDNDDASDVSYAGESDVESSGSESLSTISSSVSRRRLLVKRPKTPEIPDDKDIPVLNLPASATDLLLPTEHVLQALGVYEVLRHFRTILRLSPFTFEDFCACLLSEEQSNLLAEIHLTLLRALFREEEISNTTFGPQDLKDSINISLFFMDSMTWPEIARSYLDSEKYPEYRIHLSILESPDFPFVPYAERLKVLQTLTDLFLAAAKVREEIMNEGNIQYDDHCRACHKLGDLLCCETCSAVYHLGCVDPPMQEVPEEDWLCSVCRAHQVKGVTDCISEAEKSGLLCRQEALGYDRHTRKYWFICRRIVVEGDNEVRYYSTKYQLQELLESLSVEWEPDLISFINEMKEDIIKQMAITEELTAAARGNRKSVLEIENVQLMKIQAERALKQEEEERRKAKEEEDRKKKQEEERTKKKKEDAGDDDKDDDKSQPGEESSEVVQSDAVVTTRTEQVTNTVSKSSRGGVTTTEVVETTSTTTTVTSVKSITTTTTSTTSAESNIDNNEEDDEPISKLPKLDDTLGNIFDDGENRSAGGKDLEKSKMDNKLILSSKSVLADAIKSTTDGKQKVISLHSLLPSARQALLNAVDKNGDDGKAEGQTKTVLLLNKGGGKVTLQVSCQLVGQDEANGGSSVTHSSAATTVSVSALESRKMLTRSKTGSLTPKLFTDSITMTTTSLKASGKNSEEILVLNKDGEISRVNRAKISLASSLVQQSFYFKLGSEGSYKQYQNQYTTNTLALNKHQHNEERDKKRHLSHKFSLTQFSEFKWNGNVMGNKMSTLATLRLTITQLEGNIQAPFLHSNWPNHRQNWQKAVQMCQTPHDFALALIILEACIKPCVMNPVWHESLGHLQLSRITAADREEWKKKEKEQRRRKEDEEEVRPIVWIKYTMGLKHQVWKQKGEEYRVTGGNGWQWVSSTRSSSRVPQDSVGLRLVAQKLRNRRIKASKSKGGQLSDDDGEDSQTEEKIKSELDETTQADDGLSNVDSKLPVKEEKMEMSEDESANLSTSVEKHPDALGDNEEGAGGDQKSNKLADVEMKEEGDVKPSIPDSKEVVLTRQKGRSTFESYINLVRQKYVEDKDCAVTLELLKKHPEKVDADLIDISEAMQKRTYYPKITKPYSKLDNLLERRLKQDEFEHRQRLTIEAQIALKEKLNHAIEVAQKRRLGLETVEPAVKETTVANGEFSEVDTPSGSYPYSCYSTLCRGQDSVKTICYSPSCRVQHEKDSRQKLKSSSTLSADKVTGSQGPDSASSSNESIKASSPNNLTNEDTMDSQASKESSDSLEEDANSSEQKMSEDDSELNKENEEEQVADSAPESLPTNMSTEDEEVDIEGDTSKDGGSATASEGPLSHSSNGKPDSADVKVAAGEKTSCSSTPTSNGSLTGSGQNATFVSDIVKNLVIKTMAEKAAASSGGKGSLINAHALATTVANISIEDLRAKLPPKHSTFDKFKLARFTRIGVKKKLMKSGHLPRCHKFETSKKKKNVFILERSELRKMARLGAKKESIAFNYNCKMNNVCWLYPCPRPLFKTAWRYRTVTLQSLSAAALQLRVLWGCIRWDDMAAKTPAGGTNTISTETEITTTELLKRREVGVDGLRSEFLVRKIVVPLGVPDKPKEKYTPQRSGLRERKRVEAVRQTEPSVTEVWVPEEVLELWEIKQFGEKLEKQRQAMQEKAEKAAPGHSGVVSSQQTTAQIKAHMEQQLKQQRLALAQKRIQENQGIKVTTGGSPVAASSLAASSATTTIIINNTSQLGKPGTTFKTLTVSSPGSLLSPGVIKTLQPRTIITGAGSLLGTQLRPGIRLQVPGSGIQLRPQTVTLAPKPGTTVATTSGVSTITRLISPATASVARALSPSTPEATKTQTVQIRPQTPGQPVQNLHFTQTPSGQLQVRGLLPGQIIQRMPDGKLQIITLSTPPAAAAVTTTTSIPATAQQQLTPRSAVSIRPQAVMVSPAAAVATATPAPGTVVQNRMVIPAQLASSISIGPGSTPTTLTLSAVRPVLSGTVTSTLSKPIIVTRPGGPQIISAQNLASVLGSQNNQLLGTSSSSALLSVPPGASSLSSAVVISAPAVVSSPASAAQAVINTGAVPAVLSSSIGGVTTVLVNSSQPATLLSSVASQPGQQTIISTLKPSVLNSAVTTATVQPGISLLGGQVISGTSLLQRSAGGTSIHSLNQLSGSGATLTISGPSAASSQVPRQLTSPPAGTQIITGTQPQLLLRPTASVLTGLGQTKIITAQQLKGLTTSPVQLKPAPVSLSPVRTVLSPQSSAVIVSTSTGPKTVTAIRSLTPQLTLQTAAGQLQVGGNTAASVLSQGISLTSSPETNSAVASLTSPTPGTSPGAGAGSPKYAITPQVVEQVVRQALLQNQAPEIQQKLLAMQKQIQQQQQQSQPVPALALAAITTPTISTTVRRGSQSGVSSSAGKLVGVPAVDPSSRSVVKGLTQEQKEEQSRSSVCGQVMKNILDRIEREEKQEQRNKKKQETAEEKHKRMAAINQQKALYKHKEALKKEILRKRSLMEKNLQQEIYTEMADRLKKNKLVTNITSPPPGTGGIAAVGSVIAASSVSQVAQAASVRPKKSPAEVPKLPPAAIGDAKSAAARKRKQKIISTGAKGLNPREKLYCICKTPYDESKFYIGCDLCSNWFHGACVNIGEDRARFIDSYICEDCRRQRENTSEELYCLCRTPYDENQFYIGCDRCQDWFHGYCVGISKQEADSIEVYVCPNCQKEEVVDPIAQKPLTTGEYQQLQKLLKDLQVHKMAWPFLQPVDPKQVPDYYNVVSEPMDLTIVEAKLDARAYHKLNDFVKDVTKIFDNCRLYNPMDSAYFQCAEVVETYFAQRIKALRSANKL